MVSRFIYSSLLFLFAIASQLSFATEEIIKVYTYHDKPPYVIFGQESNTIQAGIYLELVNHLNANSSANNDGLRYELSFLPRVRLESQLKTQQLDGIVIGVNPLWFGDSTKQKYLWSNTFMDDKDIFLVNSDSTIEFQQASDLKGLTIALGRGTYYKGISELIKQGKIKAASTNSSQQNLDMLAYQRADITIMSELTANYFFNNGYPRSSFKILAKPHDTFQRSLLIPKSQSHLLVFINRALNKLNLNSDWLVEYDDWLVSI